MPAGGGRARLLNTHQDNVNAMDRATLQGYPQPMCWNVHEVQPGVAQAIWAGHLADGPLPVGWEWFARGTAVYGGGSVIDVPIAIAGDSFYFLPTHEISAGVVLVACRMDPAGEAHQRGAQPQGRLTDRQWQIVRHAKWDWDMLAMPRLDHVVPADSPELPWGTLQRPSTSAAQQAVAGIDDQALDRIIWEVPRLTPSGDPGVLAECRQQLTAALRQLVSRPWQPLLFPSGKHPREAYRVFVDPGETLYTLAVAYPHVDARMQAALSAHVEQMTREGGPLDGPAGKADSAPPGAAVRSYYDPCTEQLLTVRDCLIRSPTGRFYCLWLWAHTTGQWDTVRRQWPSWREAIKREPVGDEFDRGNARLSGLIAACRVARRLEDDESLGRLVPATRHALRDRLVFELSHAEGGVVTRPPTLRTIFGRWHDLTPEMGRLLQLYALPIHRRLMDVYVDHHRPAWWLAWGPELLWRNETPFAFPSMSHDIFAARCACSPALARATRPLRGPALVPRGRVLHTEVGAAAACRQSGGVVRDRPAIIV